MAPLIRNPDHYNGHCRLGGASLILIGWALLTLVILLLPHRHAADLTSESGLVENLSAVVLAFGCIMAVLQLWRRRSWAWVSIALLFLWMYMRELDYQKHFTPRSIESIGFYSNPKIPLAWKLTAAAALSPFALAACHLLIVSVRALRRRGQLVSVWATPAGYVAGVLGTSIISEKLLPPRFQIVEETGELAFAGLLTFFVLRAFLGAAGGRPPSDRNAPMNGPAQAISSP